MDINFFKETNFKNISLVILLLDYIWKKYLNYRQL
jgi:hypothetical protein